MKRSIGIILAGVVAGIAGCHSDAPKVATQNTTAIKNFLSQTDHLYVQTFLPEKRLYHTAPKPDDTEGVVRSVWIPGYLELQPMMVERSGEASSRLKGVRAELDETSYEIRVDGVKKDEGKHYTGECFLDEDELQDLSKAIGFFQQQTHAWSGGLPKLYTQLHFGTKEGLVLKMYPSKGQLQYAIQIGDAADDLTAVQLEEMKQEVDSEIAALKAL